MTAHHMRILDVLVIEDETRYREFLLETLRNMQCNPTGAATAKEAQQVLDTFLPDVLFLDLNLPVTNGMTFLETFRTRHRDVPVIILTGHGDLPVAQTAIRFGVTEFLTKPCHLGEIERALDRARKQIARAGSSSLNAAPEPDELEGESMTLNEIERDAILDALRACNGNRSAAAAKLGISRRSLYNKINEYKRSGIDIP